MRIGLVSTYPPIECGIATYSQYLSDALKKRKHEMYVLSQHGAKGDYVFGVYAVEDKDIATNLYLMAAKMTPDIVHIQHEFGLYGHLSLSKTSSVPNSAPENSFEGTLCRRRSQECCEHSPSLAVGARATHSSRRHSAMMTAVCLTQPVHTCDASRRGREWK